jgi:hypothetical protein
MDDESRHMTISDLTARIERAEYHIDVDAVAKAFVMRMLALRSARMGSDVPREAGDRLPAA